jgi:PAS domain S-box-containing protein
MNSEAGPASIASMMQELRRLAGPLFDALAGSELAVVVTDPRQHDNPIVFVNAGFERLTGCTAAEVLGRNCRLLPGPETDAASIAAMREALRHGDGPETELRRERKDGTPFWNRVTIIPVRDERGATAFLLAMQADVTAVRQARSVEAALRSRQAELDQANARLRATLSSSGLMASWDWHVAERRIYGDARFTALYGLDAEEAARGIAPSVFFSIIHPQDQPRVRVAVGGMLRGAEVFSKEYRVVQPDGKVRWVHARGRCIRDAGDAASRFVGTLVDITDQKRVEEKLRIAQSAGGIGTFEHVHGYGTVSVSREFCQLLGLHPSTDLPLRTVNRVVSPGHPPLIDPMVVPAAGVVSQAEFRILRPDTGESRWLMRRGETIGDSETGEFRFSGVIYDVTEAKRTEEELRRLNETLEARVAERTADRNRLWHLSADIMLVARFDGAITAVNPACCAALGVREEELVGANLLDFVHPEDFERTCAEIEYLGQHESLRRFENRSRTATGEWRWISWSGVKGGSLMYAVGRDVTAEREQAEALRQAEEQLRQSQKMEAVGQLTGGLAHDFNNLLTGITGSLGLLKARIGKGQIDQADRYLTMAQEAAARAAALTHRLLSFARRQALNAVPVDANRLVSGMQELIQRTVGPETRVVAALAPQVWSTLCDSNQLENALLNLCINARDAMPMGGCLTISTGNMTLDPREARELDMEPGQYVTICVADTGTGMTPEVIAKAFDPFFTTKPIGQGTGLGLSMTYGFVKQSGGQVNIVSTHDVGTSVRLYLPRHTGELPVAPEPASTASAPRPGTGLAVLLVDDEPTVRILAAEVLREQGYNVIEVVDGPAALAVLRSGAQVDLLITDIGLPGGLSGWQVADKARLERPHLKVLFITGYAESAEIARRHLEAGMHILTKPFHMHHLIEKAGAVLLPA